MNNMNQGKVAVVTGAGSGIGRLVSLTLHSAGYSLALVGRRLNELEHTAELGKTGQGRMLPVSADVSDPGGVRSVFDKVRNEFGRLDLLFNNAGINAPGV